MHHRRSDEEILRAQSLAGRAVNVPRLLLAAAVALPLILFANPAAAASTTGLYSAQPVYLFGIPVDFILFGLTLLGVAVFHHKTLGRATGLAAVTVYKLYSQASGRGGLHRPVLQLHHGGYPRQPVPAADGICHSVRRSTAASRRCQPFCRRLGRRTCAAIVFVLSSFLTTSRPR
jgi:hypothetical protein